MRFTRTALLAFISLWFCIPGNGQTFAAPQHWVGTWAASQQIPEPRNSLPIADMQDMTMREIFHLSVAGTTLRIRLSNAFGTEPLHFASVHIGRAVSPASAAIVPGSDAALTFSGAPDVTVPAGAEYLSDPIAYPYRLSQILLSLFILAMRPHVKRAIQARARPPITCTATTLRMPICRPRNRLITGMKSRE
jgi:hypothetical protein